ncbi:MAG TPA: hypothetical protein VFW75_05745, partial [Acetobacteraceae bacterium]|nr:hypothetical protein [Acetobacteraceae bacterium]
AAGLIAEAGAIPGTETGGDAPGTIPASPLSLASVWLGNVNQVGTLAAATATQEFLLNDLPSLLVPAGGTVLAGAAPTSIIAAGTSGTPIVLHTDPTAEINIGGGDLTIGGVVHAGLDGARTGDVLLDGGNVTIGGGVFGAHAGAVAIASRGAVEIPGVIWGDQGAPGALAGVVGLTAATVINETGSIGANVLIGSSGGHASLTGADPHTGNQIVSLGGFDSDTTADDPGGFVLHDGMGLTVSGIVTDHGAASSQGVAIAVAPAGTLAAGYGLGDLAIVNAISAMTAVNLQATGNVYETGGNITAPILRAEAGAIPGSEGTPQANQPGDIPASPLALASVWLGNTNQVGTLAAGTATQEFLLKNGLDLTVPTGAAVRAGAAPGSLAAAATAGTPIVLHVNPTAELDASGGLTVGGLVQAGLDAARPGDVILTGTNVAIDGSANAADGGALSAAAADALTVTGAISSGTAGLTGASVNVSGVVTTTSSVAAAATGGLSVFGTITTGIATLQGASITVAGLLDAAGSVTAVAGDPLSIPGTINTGVATLQAASITVGGTVNADTSTAATAGSGLLVSGVINTGAASLQATSLAIQGAVSAAGSLLATAGNDLSISGAVNAGTAGLEGTSIAIAGALHTAGNLSATAGGELSVTGAVSVGGADLHAASIAIPGAMSAAGNLTATASNEVSVPGALNAGSATLSGNSITIHGRSTAGTSMALISAGTIDATDGNLTTPLLTGSAGTNATLSGSNQIGQLNNFSAGGTLEVNDDSALLLSGAIVAPLILVNDPQQITLGDGAQIVTGGIARPPSLVLTATGSNSPLADPAAFGGAYLTDFQQIGNSTVSGIGGGPSILGIVANPGKSISFSNLSGLNTWVVLQTVGNASITGNLFVKSLDVVHSGLGGSANLFGEINGLPGVQAAGAGKIAPTINASFRFNNCTISSVNCILLPTLTIPTANPLNDFSLTASSSPDDDEDLLLPIVSDEDY